MDQYASHQQALVGAVMRSTGAVLEFGAGDYSTPILHEICRAQGRLLLTMDSNKDWLDRFRHLECDHHSFRHVTDWSELRISRVHTLGVAFVDHSPGERRKIEVERLRKAGCTFVVVHDTEPNPAAGYGLEPVFAKFKYRFDFGEKPWTPGCLPWTTVVSDTHDWGYR